MALPSPGDLLGLKDQFPTWYDGQDKTFSKIMDWYYSPARFLGLAAATGAGKSLDALLTAKLSNARTVILTATKGLQQQYLNSAKLIGGVAVVGQNNFRCSLVPSLTADEGPCHDGISCSFKEDACPYRIQLARALSSKLVITNYAYYLAQTNFSSGLGEIGLLCLDESHLAFSAMENYLTLFLSRMDVESMGVHFPTITPKISAPQPPESTAKTSKSKKGTVIPPDNIDPTILEGSGNAQPSEWQQWQEWSAGVLPAVQEFLKCVESDIKSLRQKDQPIPGAASRAYRSAKSVVARLERLSTVGEDWVIQQTNHGYRFVPTWVKNYSHHIFKSVPKVILMSAILSHRTADYLGVPPAPDREWVEAESYFPAENTPIWHIPTARINFRTDDYGSTIWCSRIDQIIQRRLDRKGIIFTVSYDRARLLLQRSRFRDIMLAHSTNDVVYVVNKFKAMKPPAILVSPTVTTGWDFPMLVSGGGKPQYGIVGKIPYPDTKNEVTHARSMDDKDWTAFLAMDIFIQECGRLTRTPEDLAEIFVVDDVFRWWWYAYKGFAPKWFQARVRGSLTCVPEPLV